MNCYSNCLLCFKLFQRTSLKQSTIILGLLFCRISLTLLLYKNLHLLLSFPARQISLSQAKAFCCLTELKLSNAPKQKISAKIPGPPGFIRSSKKSNFIWPSGYKAAVKALLEGPFPPRFFFLPFHARSKPQLDQDAVLRWEILWANFSGKKHHLKVFTTACTVHGNCYCTCK